MARHSSQQDSPREVVEIVADRSGASSEAFWSPKPRQHRVLVWIGVVATVAACLLCAFAVGFAAVYVYYVSR